jgi:hypothetical protein
MSTAKLRPGTAASAETAAFVAVFRRSVGVALEMIAANTITISDPNQPEFHAASALARVEIPADPVRSGARRRCSGRAESASRAQPTIRAGVIL